MTKMQEKGVLDFANLGNVDKTNNGFIIGGMDKDIHKMSSDISIAASQILSPVKVTTENFLDTFRHPIDNIINPNVKNGSWKKIIPFVGSTMALAVAQALDKPFATVQKTIEYVITNNLERGIGFTKGISTEFLANLITNNGESKNKVVNFVGNGVKGTGNLVGSLAKSVPWVIEKAIGLPRNIKGYGTEAMANKTTQWVNAQQINNKSYLKPNYGNTEEAKNAS